MSCKDFKPAYRQLSSAIYRYSLVLSHSFFFFQHLSVLFYGTHDHRCKRTIIIIIIHKIIHQSAVGLVWISGSVLVGAAPGTCAYPVVILAASLLIARAAL